LQLKIERLEMEHRVDAERRRIARDLHDEVGSHLTRIAQLGEMATKENQPSHEIKSQVSAITDRVRELISAMDEVVWTVNPRNDVLTKVVAYLSDYIETFVAPMGISHRLELDADFPPLPVLAESRHHLLLAVKEALNNAVRHATPKFICVGIHIRNTCLEVSIADDGCGFEVEQARSRGRGLANLDERMRIIHGRVEITSKAGKGTTVTLTMPLSASKAHD
jgi:signal transduction histidine kinase